MGKLINTILNLKDNFSPTLTKASGNSKKFISQLKSAETQADKLTKTFSKFAKLTAGIGIAGIGVTVKSSIDTFKNFEQAMAQTAATVGIDKFSDDYARMEKAAREAGKVTTKSAKESAEALGYMALAGWSVDDSINGLMPILRLSEATQADTAITADLATDSMSALGLKAEDLGRYLDTATVANNKSNQTAQMLMEAYIGVGGTFNRLETPLNESAGLLGVLANRGIKASEAGNSLNSLLINLTKKSGESYEAMQKLNISAYDSEGNFKGVTNVLKELNEKTKNLTGEQRDLYFQMIGGKTQITTLNALMSGLNTVNGEGVNELDALTEALSNTDGALNEMADNVTNTMSGAFSRMGSAIDEARIAIGEKIAPYLTPIINSLSEKINAASEKFSESFDRVWPKIEGFFKNLKNIFLGLGRHADILIPILIDVVGTLGSFVIIVKITSFINKFKTAGGGLMGILKALNLTMLANPFVWVATSIGALIAIFIIAYKKSETFRNFVNQLWTKLKEFGKGLATNVVSGVKTFYGWFKDKVIPILIKVAGYIPPIWNKFKEFASSIVSVVVPALQSMWSWFQEKIMPILSSIAQNMQYLWNQVLVPGIQIAIEKLGELWNFMQPFVSFLKDVFGAAFSGAFEYIKGTITTAIGTIKGLIEGLLEIFNGVITFVNGVFTGNWEMAWEGIKGIFSGIVDGIKSIFKGVINSIINILNGFIKGANGMIGILGKIPGFSWAQDVQIPTIPQFATGTEYAPGGIALVGEYGPELVSLPKGSKVTTASKTQDILNKKNQQIQININVQGNLIGNRQMAEEMGNIIAKKILTACANI